MTIPLSAIRAGRCYAFGGEVRKVTSVSVTSVTFIAVARGQQRPKPTAPVTLPTSAFAREVDGEIPCPEELFAVKRASLSRDDLVTRVAVKEGDALRQCRLDDAQAAAHDPYRDLWARDADDMRERMLPGDELWTWSSPDWTWRERMGRAGLAIVCDGEVVEFTIRLMS